MAGVFCASVRGSGHMRHDVPNQDSWLGCHAHWGDLLVVSDGLGSMPHARLGADAACAAVSCAAAMAHWQNPQLADLPCLIHANWLRLVSPLNPESCGATCLFALRRDGNLWLGQLGDGMIVALGRHVDGLVFEDLNEFVNVTDCLGAHFFPESWQWAVVPENALEGVVISTDGVSVDIPDSSKSAFCRDFWEEYRHMEPRRRKVEMEAMLEAWPGDGNGDDKTIGCLWLE